MMHKMNRLWEFYKKVIDSFIDSIVVIDNNGSIIFVNKSWVSFGENNSCLIVNNWNGINYIEECDKAAKAGDFFGREASNGIK